MQLLNVGRKAPGNYNNERGSKLEHRSAQPKKEINVIIPLIGPNPVLLSAHQESKSAWVVRPTGAGPTRTNFGAAAGRGFSSGSSFPLPAVVRACYLELCYLLCLGWLNFVEPTLPPCRPAASCSGGALVCTCVYITLSEDSDTAVIMLRGCVVLTSSTVRDVHYKSLTRL